MALHIFLSMLRQYLTTLVPDIFQHKFQYLFLFDHLSAQRLVFTFLDHATKICRELRPPTLTDKYISLELDCKAHRDLLTSPFYMGIAIAILTKNVAIGKTRNLVFGKNGLLSPFKTVTESNVHLKIYVGDVSRL